MSKTQYYAPVASKPHFIFPKDKHNIVFEFNWGT